MHRLYPSFARGWGAVGLLILRVVTGAAFMFHGWYKYDGPGGPVGWMGADASVPGVFQGMAVLAEFGGGLALILGLLTPIAALGIAFTMIVALGTVHLPLGHRFVAQKHDDPSFELAAGYLANAILLLLIGPGVFSFDAILFGNQRRQT